ncbi:hypothetical protein [Caldisericum sp. AR60]|uniref:hypothetical protein n=1 Tax=Caldisericum sp. AR60 TaxID=3397852 RepID=UPI0039FCA1C0
MRYATIGGRDKKVFNPNFTSLILLSTFGCKNETTGSGKLTVKVISPNVETQVEYSTQPEKGIVTYKPIKLNIFGGLITTFCFSCKMF